MKKTSGWVWIGRFPGVISSKARCGMPLVARLLLED